MCQPCWCANADKMSSNGLGAFAVISMKDSVSSILGSDMYCACRSVHCLACAAFCSGVWRNETRHNIRSDSKADLTTMPVIMRQLETRRIVVLGSTPGLSDYRPCGRLVRHFGDYVIYQDLVALIRVFGFGSNLLPANFESHF